MLITNDELKTIVMLVKYLKGYDLSNCNDKRLLIILKEIQSEFNVVK